MQKTKARLCVAVSLGLALTSCATTNEYQGKAVGTGVGAGVGCALAIVLGKDCAKGALIGAAVGFGVGAIYDYRKKAVQEAATRNNVQVVFHEVTTKNYSAGKDQQKPTKGQKNTAANNALVASIYDPSLFKSGSSTLTPKSRKAFEDIALAYLQGGQKVMIVGHSDASGNAKTNQKLSEQRAKTVADIFKNAGVEKEDIFYQGAGESQPVASNQTAAGRAENRRVEIVEIESEKSLSQYSYEQKSNPIYLTSKTTGTDAKASPSSPVPSKKLARMQSIDFGGQRTNGVNPELYANMGEQVQQSTFSFISEAKASAPIGYSSCIQDEYRVSGDVIRLDSGKKLIDHRSSEFMPGLYETTWTDKVNAHLVGLKKVGVLRDGAQVSSNPTLLVYTDYKGPTQRATRVDSTRVNAYEGKSGILYRVFVSSPENPIECIDIVFPKTPPFLAKTGVIYYQKNNKLFEADFQPKMVKR